MPAGPAAPRRLRAAVLLVLGLTLGLLAGCGTDDDDASASRESRRTESTTTTSSTTTTEPTTTTTTTTTEPPPTSTTTTAPPPTTAPPAPPPPPGADADGVLRPGESGEHVRNLQQRLTDLGYWVGEVDGNYGLTTRQAVLAFQKAEGLGRDGIAGAETLNRLPAASRVTAASTSGHLIEVDLARQLLFVIQDGRVLWAFNSSTGTSATPTPPGTFTINRQIDGTRHAPLGILFRPKYFNGGIAVHGSDSIPGYPASHGCVRVSDPAINWLWASGVAEIGTTVWVH